MSLEQATGKLQKQTTRGRYVNKLYDMKTKEDFRSTVA